MEGIKTEVVICECGSTEHQIIFSKFDDEGVLYCHIHLNKRPFFKRLWIGIRYIFGYGSRFGNFDEFILTPDAAYTLYEALNNKSKKENG